MRPTRSGSRLRSHVASLAVALVVSVLLAPVPAVASAEQRDTGAAATGPTVITRVDDIGTTSRLPLPPRSLDRAAGIAGAATLASTSDIVFDFSASVPAGVQAAFEAAALAWETTVVSTFPIVATVDWEPLGTNVLGSAGPNSIIRDFTGAPLPATWYPVALANTFFGADLNGTAAEISMRFSSQFSWHLDPNTSPPPGAFDLTTVVIHELGHGLGFVGSATVVGGIGSIGNSGYPIVYDRFVATGAGTPVLSIPDGAALAAALQSEDLVFTGPAATAAFGTSPQIEARPEWREGSSFSHFSEADYPAGTENALMTPSLMEDEVIRNVGSGTLGLLADLGWAVATGPLCQGLVPTITGSGVINGTGADDVILGSSGNDTIFGFGGDDVICGLGGDDVIRGYAGNDLIDAGPGDDDATGGNGADTIFGGPGIDKVKGEADDDVVDGGAGDDRVIGGDGGDDLFGGDGVDVLRGEDGDDHLDGGPGDDILAGNDDDDVLVGGAGADEFRGGSGDDTADYSGSATAVVVKLNNTADDGAAGEGDFVDLGVENVIGSPLDDRIVGSDADNVLTGLDGDDVLLGRDGDDTFDGGSGFDFCNGNNGVDTQTGCEQAPNVP